MIERFFRTNVLEWTRVVCARKHSHRDCWEVGSDEVDGKIMVMVAADNEFGGCEPRRTNEKAVCTDERAKLGSKIIFLFVEVEGLF